MIKNQKKQKLLYWIILVVILPKLGIDDKLDPVVGREKEIERVAQILSRRKKE